MWRTEIAAHVYWCVVDISTQGLQFVKGKAKWIIFYFDKNSSVFQNRAGHNVAIGI